MGRTNGGSFGCNPNVLTDMVSSILTPSTLWSNKMKTTNKVTRRIGFRWGKVMNAIDVARYSLGIASDERLLSPDLTKRLEEAYNLLYGIEQDAWVEESKL